MGEWESGWWEGVRGGGRGWVSEWLSGCDVSGWEGRGGVGGLAAGELPARRTKIEVKERKPQETNYR